MAATLPTSGALSLSNIQTEFGGSNPISLSEYYRSGGLVPNNLANASIPTSSLISVSDFYGSSVANLEGEVYSASGSIGTITIELTFASRTVTGPSAVGTYNWIPSWKTASDFDVRLVYVSGSGGVEGGLTKGVWYNLNSQRRYTLSLSEPGEISYSYFAELRPAGGGSTISSVLKTLNINKFAGGGGLDPIGDP